MPAFQLGRVSLGLLSHQSLSSLKSHNAKPDRETRINTRACFYLLCIHPLCLCTFPSGNRDQLLLPGILCAHPPDEVVRCMVHSRLWHLTALQGSPGLWAPTYSLGNTRTSHSHSVLSYKKQKQEHLDGA